MYINFLNDRKSLGYECLIDTQCGNRLVLITDSSVVFVKNVRLNGKRKIFVSIAVIIIIFSDVKSADAIGTNLLPQQRVVSLIPDRDTNRLMKPSKVKINSYIEPKIMMPSLSKKVKNSKEPYLPTYIYLMDDKLLRRPEIRSIIRQLRGGAFVDVATGLAIIAVVILLTNSANGFQPNPHMIVPPHLQWLYGNNYQPGQFGYGKNTGPRSITVTGMTQNAGSDKKNPSSGSWDYKEVMRELDRQSSKKRIYAQVGDQIYILKNPYHEGAYELADKLADQIYESIRESDTDICDIAQNLGFKADNIKHVKDHVFYNEHDLDRHPDRIERKQFDPDLQQALSWKRLQNGNHTQADVTWIKHECAERHHELKYGSGYNEAHNRAQTRFDGAPWENQF
uniref:hypothetical protein n=1 Tax=Candidatus Electrothrix sp. TaxID=2170559 RepID=UPI004057B427